MPRQIALVAAILTVLWTMSGCEKQPRPDDTPTSSNTASSVAKATAASKKAASLPASTMATPNQIRAQCQDLTKKMQAVNGHTALPVLHTINTRLKQCVPHADNAQLLTWMAEHEAMYRRFLELSDEDYKGINELGYDYDGHTSIAQDKLDSLKPRAKYLASLLGKSEIVLTSLGEGEFAFEYLLSTTTKLFTPYLPKDQALFITHSAAENQEPMFNDAAITLSYAQMVEHTQFWENFIKMYPKSHFYQQAKDNFEFYQYYTFFGSDNTQWTEDDLMTTLAPANRKTLETVANTPNSEFATHAKIYLEFLQMPIAERNARYPVPKQEEGMEKSETQMAHEQLHKALANLTLDDHLVCSALGFHCKPVSANE